MTEQEPTKLDIGGEWLTTGGAAQVTGYTQAYMRQLAKRKRVRSFKVGRDWVLNRADLLEYTRAMEALGEAKHNPWKETREDLARTGRGR